MPVGFPSAVLSRNCVACALWIKTRASHLGPTSASSAILSDLDDGPWYVRVCSRDAYHAWGPWSDPRRFTVDTTSPVIDLTSPVGGETVAGAVVLSASASDAQAGLAPSGVWFSWSVDGSNWNSIGSTNRSTPGAHTLTWDTTPLRDAATYRIKANVTDALGMRCTVSLSMSVIQHFPAILEGMVKRNWELMSHGIYNTRYHWNFTPEEERAAMQESREIHRRLVGTEQKGWFSPAITNTLETFENAAACGFDYTADLYHDDQPFPIKTREGKLLSMPYSVDLNDAILIRRGQEAEEFGRQIRDHFDTVYAEGADQGEKP